LHARHGLLEIHPGCTPPPSAAWAEAFTQRTGLPVEVTEDPDA